MLELRLVQGILLKKVLEAIKGLFKHANFEFSDIEFSLQAMDSSHVALVTLLLRPKGFEHYRCDRSISMGMNLNNMSKMLKFVGNDDIVTIRADDGSDTVTFMFESPIVIFMTNEDEGEVVVKFSTRGDLMQNIAVEEAEEATVIEMNEAVTSLFALRFIDSFTKATPLSNTVTIGLISGKPVALEYKVAEMGYIRFYLDDHET